MSEEATRAVVSRWFGALDAGDVDTAIDHASILTDQNHCGQGQNPHLIGQAAVLTAAFVNLRPGNPVCFDEFGDGGCVAI